MKVFCWLLTIIINSGCVTPNPSVDQEKMTEEYSIEKVWYAGTAEQAFAEAREKNKPLFVYWGAIWCPPCNELKSNVFSRPRFKELMKPFVPVYLDGDSEEAQLWGEKLKASGYPTIIVLSSELKEVTRIDGGIDFKEFTRALESVLKTNRPFDQVIGSALEGQAADADWQTLSFVSWGQIPKFKKVSNEILDLRMTLASKIPERLANEKSALVSKTLTLAAALSDKSETKKKIRRNQKDYLATIFKNPDFLFGVRSSIHLVNTVK